MSKKFLLSQAAGTKLAVGLATIGGVSASTSMILNNHSPQPTSPEAALANDTINQDTNLEALPSKEISLPTKVTNVTDNPIKPYNDNTFNSNKEININDLELSKSTREEEEKIPFETKVEYDENKSSNYRAIIQEGVDGYKITTFSDSFDNDGKLIKTIKEKEENNPPIPQIIVIGTNQNIKDDIQPLLQKELVNKNENNIEVRNKKDTEKIPRDTIYTIDENLKKDESYTINGYDGLKEITNTIVSVNNKEVFKDTTKEEIIEPASNDVTYISKEEYDKRIKTDNYDEIEVSNIKENKDSIRKEFRNSNNRELKFNTIVTKDDTLPIGEIVIDQLGINGSEYDVYQDVYVNDSLVSSIIDKTITVKPIDQIERHGTKEINIKGPGPNEEIRETLHEDKKGIPGAEAIQKTVKETNVKDIPTEVIYDDNLPQGTENVVVEGQPEVTETTYKITSVNDEIVSKEKISDNIVSKGISKVVKIGTGKSSKSFDTVVNEISYDTEIIYDENLSSKDSYIKQAGENGSENTVYETTYMNGKVISKEVASVTRIKNPIKEIKVVGTKNENVSNNNINTGAVYTNNIIDLKLTRDISSTQGLKIGDKFSNGATIKDLKIEDNTPLEKIVTLPENERYEKGQKDYYNTMITELNGYSITSGIPLSQGSIDFINEHLDPNLLAMYMLQYVNDLRSSLGKAPLQYKAELQKGTQQRADEQAEIGSLRSNNIAHTRPNGTEFRTAFNYLGNNEEQKLGENIAQFSSLNQYTLTSEKLIAEKLFNQWKKSPGHYSNMVSDMYKYFSFAVSISRTTDNMREYSEWYPSIIGVQIFEI